MIRAKLASNFSSKKLADLIAVARVPPAVDQVECHLGWQQAKLIAFCHSIGVHLSVSKQFCEPYWHVVVSLWGAVVCADVLSSGVCAAGQDEGCGE
jgi:alcohol dehydrogenase (NADP+)